MFFKIGTLRKFAILTGKHLCWSLFLQKETSTQVFFFEYCKIFKNSFFYRKPLMAAFELKSNISKENLNKSKKKLSLYFDDSHRNQTNTTKKMLFFYTLLTSTRI